MRFGLSEKVIENLVNLFSAFDKIEEVTLFGSRAKGTFKEGSDIDLSLKGSMIDLQYIRKIELEIDRLDFPYAVDLVIYDKIKEPLLTEHINRIGICIYHRLQNNSPQITK